MLQEPQRLSSYLHTGCVDIFLCRKEDDHIALPLLRVDLKNCSNSYSQVVVLRPRCEVVDVDREVFCGHLQNGGAREVLLQLGNLERWGHQYQLQFRPRSQGSLKKTQQCVNGRSSSVGVVHQDNTISGERWVRYCFPQEGLCADHAKESVWRSSVIELDVIADEGADWNFQLLCNPLGGQESPKRVRMNASQGLDSTILDVVSRIQQDLRQLRRLSGASIADHQNNLLALHLA
mmetsp:Transcript_58392/g.123860  ORF Transcript_58392/g.123860 Transcript_58392/m.123860 type:complete len:234 (+) Transcript_58392:1467-2168(+)